MKRRMFTLGLAVASLPLMGMSCEPEQVEQAVRFMSVDSRPSELRPAPHPSHPSHDVQFNCPDMTVTLTNTDPERFWVYAWYGVHQRPIGQAVDGWYPYVEPGQTFTFDLTPAAGEDVTVFIDGGAIADIFDVHC